jgi:hypothetical protein
MVKIGSLNLKDASLEIPSGTYDTRIKKIDFFPENKDEGKEYPGFSVWNEIINNSNKSLNGKIFFKNYSLSPNSKGFVRQFLIACGYTPKQLDDPNFEFDTDAVKGKCIQWDYQKDEGQKYPNINNPTKI